MRGARIVVGVATVGVLVVVAAIGVSSLRDRVQPFFSPDRCTASVDGHTVTLDPEQATNAALISAISIQRGMPARAASIALATALQESKLYNLPGGDRDSLGLFQQRPSQGWGTPKEILDPTHATNAFYDALARIDGYGSMQITVAAQDVQHSGFPEAYAGHEADARALASALTGQSGDAFSCRLHTADKPLPGNPARRARAVGTEVTGLFGHLARHVSGHSLDLSVPAAVGGSPTGWAVASYLIANAERLHLLSVGFDDRTWSVADSRAGWVASNDASRAVHVDVE